MNNIQPQFSMDTNENEVYEQAYTFEYTLYINICDSWWWTELLKAGLLHRLVCHKIWFCSLFYARWLFSLQIAATSLFMQPVSFEIDHQQNTFIKYKSCILGLL
jgi:hypothetical protein